MSLTTLKTTAAVAAAHVRISYLRRRNFPPHTIVTNIRRPAYGDQQLLVLRPMSDLEIDGARAALSADSLPDASVKLADLLEWHTGLDRAALKTLSLAGAFRIVSLWLAQSIVVRNRRRRRDALRVALRLPARR